MGIDRLEKEKVVVVSLDKTQIFQRNHDVPSFGGIRLAGFSKNGTGVKQKWRQLSSYCLVFVVSGIGIFSDRKGREFRIRTGDVFLSHPKVAHYYGPLPGKSWDEYYILFEGDVFDLLNRSGLFKWPNSTLNLPALKYWAKRFRDVSSRENTASPKKMMEEVISLQSLLTDLYATSKYVPTDDLEWLTLAKEAMLNSKSNDDAAKSLGLKNETFRKKFKRISGNSPGRYRISLVIDSACKLIETTSLSMKDISRKLGYCDEYHFSKQFSKTVGVTPIEYRSRASNQPFDDISL